MCRSCWSSSGRERWCVLWVIRPLWNSSGFTQVKSRRCAHRHGHAHIQIWMVWPCSCSRKGKHTFQTRQPFNFSAWPACPRVFDIATNIERCVLHQSRKLWWSRHEPIDHDRLAIVVISKMVCGSKNAQTEEVWGYSVAHTISHNLQHWGFVAALLALRVQKALDVWYLYTRVLLPGWCRLVHKRLWILDVLTFGYFTKDDVGTHTRGCAYDLFCTVNSLCMFPCRRVSILCHQHIWVRYWGYQLSNIRNLRCQVLKTCV